MIPKHRRLPGLHNGPGRGLGALALVALLGFGAPLKAQTPTNTWCDFYGNATVLGAPVEPGDEILVYDPQGVLCGRFVVHTPGRYGYLHVYGDDPTTPEDEGATEGDTLRFRINGLIAHPDRVPLWHGGNPGAIVHLNLAVTETYLVGDADGDGDVDPDDLQFLAAYLYQKGPAPNPLARADLNADSRVDDQDLVALARHLMQEGKSGSPPSPGRAKGDASSR